MRLLGIDFLRTLAVLFVILSHFGYKQFAGYGVPLLIVISSFFIARILINADESYTFKKHFVRRFLRIAPAYYSFLFVTISLDYILGDYWTWDEVLFALTHTFNYWNIQNGHTSTISHVWTLSILEQLFIASFFLLPPILRLKEGKFWAVGILIVVLAIIYRSILYLFVGVSDAYVYNDFFCRIDQYMIGVMLGYFYVNHNSSWRHISIANAIVLLLGSIALIKVTAVSHDIKYTVGFTIEAVSACLLLYSFTAIAKSVSILNSKFVIALASFSYSAYLYHSWSNSAAKALSDLGPTIQVIAALILPFMIGIVVYHSVEKYFLRIKKRILSIK